MLEAPWLSSLLDEILLFVMLIGSRAKNSSSTHSMTTSRPEVQWIPSLQMVENEISKKVADLLTSLFIKQYESEPYHHYQNKTEQRYHAVKRYINTLIPYRSPSSLLVTLPDLCLCPPECHSLTCS